MGWILVYDCDTSVIKSNKTIVACISINLKINVELTPISIAIHSTVYYITHSLITLQARVAGIVQVVVVIFY